MMPAVRLNFLSCNGNGNQCGRYAQTAQTQSQTSKQTSPHPFCAQAVATHGMWSSPRCCNTPGTCSQRPPRLPGRRQQAGGLAGSTLASSIHFTHTSSWQGRASTCPPSWHSSSIEAAGAHQVKKVCMSEARRRGSSKLWWAGPAAQTRRCRRKDAERMHVKSMSGRRTCRRGRCSRW